MNKVILFYGKSFNELQKEMELILTEMKRVPLKSGIGFYENYEYSLIPVLDKKEFKKFLSYKTMILNYSQETLNVTFPSLRIKDDYVDEFSKKYWAKQILQIISAY